MSSLDNSGQICFFLKLGYFPKIKKPLTFNEKVLFRKQYLMLDIKYKYLSDKLLVRDYVRERIGDDYFVPLLYHTTSPDTLLNCSPQCDVMLKPNHGAGMFRVVRAADYDVEKKRNSLFMQKMAANRFFSSSKGNSI